MSRGLSDQQRKILGLGVRINRAVNGGALKPIEGEPVQDGRWRIPVLLSPGFPEVTVRYVMRILYGVPVSKTMVRAGEIMKNTGFFAHTPQTRTIKASVTRAIRSLERGGYIHYRPDAEKFLGRYIVWEETDPPKEGREWGRGEYVLRPDLTDDNLIGQQWGYALRPKGIDVGLKYEPDMPLPDVLLALAEVQQGSGKVAGKASRILRQMANAITVTPDYDVTQGNAYESAP